MGNYGENTYEEYEKVLFIGGHNAVRPPHISYMGTRLRLLSRRPQWTDAVL